MDEKIYLTEFDFYNLPDCYWCNGGGTCREDISDTGYDCPDCYGSGKDGWSFDPVTKQNYRTELQIRNRK